MRVSLIILNENTRPAGLLRTSNRGRRNSLRLKVKERIAPELCCRTQDSYRPAWVMTLLKDFGQDTRENRKRISTVNRLPILRRAAKLT
jgi:hypothetical protein